VKEGNEKEDLLPKIDFTNPEEPEANLEEIPEK
jgi:hypothetical protein